MSITEPSTDLEMEYFGVTSPVTGVPLTVLVLDGVQAVLLCLGRGIEWQSRNLAKTGLVMSKSNQHCGFVSL